jgi:hypothetical protein
MAIKDAIKVNTGCICDNETTAHIPLIAVNGGSCWFIMSYKLKFVRVQEFLHLQFQINQDSLQ